MKEILAAYADLIPFAVVWSGCAVVGLVYILFEYLTARSQCRGNDK
jgi:hypothetical protein